MYTCSAVACVCLWKPFACCWSRSTAEVEHSSCLWGQLWDMTEHCQAKMVLEIKPRVWWATRWAWVVTLAAATHALSWQRHAQAANRDGCHIVHAGERCSALLAPSPLLSPSASDNHAKCNLQHCLHLFTFTNYILLKLPRKICQKNVITQSWNWASSQISSIFKKHYGISPSWQHQAAARDRAEPQWCCHH